MIKDNFMKGIEIHILKILSLITAAFLWFYVVNSEPVIVERSYEIKVLTPSGVALDDISHRKVKVKLKGARAFLKEYKGIKFLLNIDLTKKNLTKGDDYKHFFSDVDLSLPFGIDLVETTPEFVDLHFDRNIKKSIPIKIETDQDLPEGLRLVSSKLSPSKVMIEGPISAMKKIGQTSTVTLDLDHLSGQGEVEVSLAKLPPFIKYLDESAVKLNYDIRPTSANIKVDDIAILFVSTTQKYKSETTKVSVELLSTKKEVRASQVKVYAQVPSKKGIHRVKLDAQLPEGVHLLKINPQFIKVRKY